MNDVCAVKYDSVRQEFARTERKIDMLERHLGDLKCFLEKCNDPCQREHIKVDIVECRAKLGVYQEMLDVLGKFMFHNCHLIYTNGEVVAEEE